jgi:NAD(P)-dependent dehydrogenase (short-subunit alcohol dehydrogenase family)
MTTHNRSALVTGATSGLGFEAAAQLADHGYETVFITGRSASKAAAAAKELAARTGRSVFVPVTVDFDRLDTIDPAASDIAQSGRQIDRAILNAGIVAPPEVTMSSDGIERVVSSTLIGHHRLTMRLLGRGALSPSAAIVIAGSEAARGDVPMFTPIDLQALANDQFDGDLEGAIEAQMKISAPAAYKPNDQYATAKVLVAWWAAALSRRLPEGMTVNAVSPGSTPDTNGIRNAPAYMRYMLPVLKLIPGMAHSVADGAKRYLDGADLRDSSGDFFASRPKRMTGDLVKVELGHINDRVGQEAAWNVTSKLAGAEYPTPV